MNTCLDFISDFSLGSSRLDTTRYSPCILAYMEKS